MTNNNTFEGVVVNIPVGTTLTASNGVFLFKSALTGNMNFKEIVEFFETEFPQEVDEAKKSRLYWENETKIYLRFGRVARISVDTSCNILTIETPNYAYSSKNVPVLSVNINISDIERIQHRQLPGEEIVLYDKEKKALAYLVLEQPEVRIARLLGNKTEEVTK